MPYSLEGAIWLRGSYALLGERPELPDGPPSARSVLLASCGSGSPRELILRKRTSEGEAGAGEQQDVGLSTAGPALSAAALMSASSLVCSTCEAGSARVVVGGPSLSCGPPAARPERSARCSTGPGRGSSARARSAGCTIVTTFGAPGAGPERIYAAFSHSFVNLWSEDSVNGPRPRLERESTKATQQGLSPARPDPFGLGAPRDPASVGCESVSRPLRANAFPFPRLNLGGKCVLRFR